jgi:hypothetical protein
VFTTAVAVAVELTTTTINAQTPMEAQGDSAAEELEVRMATLAELEAQTLPQQLELLTPAVAEAELTQKISTREPVDPE